MLGYFKDESLNTYLRKKPLSWKSYESYDMESHIFSPAATASQSNMNHEIRNH